MENEEGGWSVGVGRWRGWRTEGEGDGYKWRGGRDINWPALRSTYSLCRFDLMIGECNFLFIFSFSFITFVVEDEGGWW